MLVFQHFWSSWFTRVRLQWMHNSLGEISHRFGKNTTEIFLAQEQRSVQEIKKHPVESMPSVAQKQKCSNPKNAFHLSKKSIIHHTILDILDPIAIRGSFSSGQWRRTYLVCVSQLQGHRRSSRVVLPFIRPFSIAKLCEPVRYRVMQIRWNSILSLNVGFYNNGLT